MLLGFRIAFFKVTESESLAVAFTAWHLKSEYFSALHFYCIFIKSKLLNIHFELLFKPPFCIFSGKKKVVKNDGFTGTWTRKSSMIVDL